MTKPTSLLDAARSGSWLPARRIVAWGWILFALEVATLVFIAAGQHGLIVDGVEPVTTDFSSFYSAGWLVNQGSPALVYDIPSHRLAQQAIYGHPDVNYNFFFYPPILLLVCSALASLPYLPAFYVWAGVQAALYLAAVRRVVPTGASLVPWLAFPAAPTAFALGQNSMLTAALFCAGTWLLLERRREFWAGLLLGALCYKPHFGVLLPVVFVAGRHWRAVGGAAVSVAGLCAAVTVLYGWEIWAAYLQLFAASGPRTFETGRIPYSGLISPFASVMLVGGGKETAYAVQALCTAGVAAVAWRIWSRGVSAAAKAMALTAGTMLAVPVILIYDFLPAAVAMAWLAREARDTGWLPWEKSLLAACFAVALMGRFLAYALEVPYGPFVGAVLLAFAWRRAFPPCRAADGARGSG